MSNRPKAKIGLVSATCIVVASMIGTGVFTGLGFQALDIKSEFVLLLLWFLSGVVTICGALTYAELAANMPRSGGEYHYLSKVFHPIVGFMSGWISLTVGFASPIAVSAMAFAFYMTKIYPIDKEVLATILITLLTFLNLFGIKSGSRFHNMTTIFNVILILSFIFSGIFIGQSEHFHFTVTRSDLLTVIDPAFAVSLIYSSFAYSGWNSAAYIAGEVSNPGRNLPRALLYGTLIVLILYMLLNFVFLYTVPVHELAGKVEVGFIAGENIFGRSGGLLIAALISLGLVASVNALIITGPRVAETMGEDYPYLQKLSIANRYHAPWFSIILQSIIALFLIYTSSFEAVITYIGFTINLFSTLTVFGIFIFRFRIRNRISTEKVYRTWGYPVVPIIFIAQQSWMLFYLAKEKSTESLAGLLTVAVGLCLYFLVNRKREEEKLAS